MKTAITLITGLLLSLILIITACPPSGGETEGTPSPQPEDTPTPPPGYSSLIDDWPEESILTLSRATGYQVETSVTVTNTNASVSKLWVILPVPRSNCYQAVANENLNGGELVEIPDTSDHLARFITTENLPAPGESITFSISFDITIHEMAADLAAATPLQAYDTGSDIYTYYRGNSGDLVDITHSEIISAGDSLWSGSSDVLDYIYNCYEYVALNFDYLNPLTGLHSIDTLITNGGGDCGNLSSLFISLLRYKDIPARHLVSIRPNGTFHAWADFYLEGYGWVPADVTYAEADAEGDDTIDNDYFGDISLENNGIIFSKEVYLDIDLEDSVQTVSLLQNFLWWYQGSGDMTAEFALNSVEL